MYYQQPTPIGTGYVPQQLYINKPVSKNTQPLTQDQQNMLKNDRDSMDWKVSQTDLLRSVCTHKDNHGNMTLTMDPDGYLRCGICGERFKMYEGDVQEVERVVNDMLDILQTCKTVYLDVPEAFAAAYYQFIPLLKKLPSLWTRANNNWMQYNNAEPTMMANVGYQTNPFQMLGQLTGNPTYGFGGFMPQQPVMGMGYPQQPGMQMPMGTPMAPQQPMAYPQQNVAPQQPGMQMPMNAQMPQNQYQQPAYQQPLMNGMVAPNPLAYGSPAVAPMPGNIPAPTAPSAAPAAPAQPVAEAPAANGDVVQSQTFNV